ncbi:hypothetical protein F443_22542 [Phytophthora nicotianae P1569]|uniref:Uncharacterized protein n=1 Tax=Phytophthora nicotianae P1569 TaxID=1317065 RepID=V9DUM4_PHYNI|nr:hypothetical protein F443_22542 [Phytophthora nicotianae P1569]
MSGAGMIWNPLLFPDKKEHRVQSYHPVGHGPRGPELSVSWHTESSSRSDRMAAPGVLRRADGTV